MHHPGADLKDIVSPICGAKKIKSSCAHCKKKKYTLIKESNLVTQLKKKKAENFKTYIPQNVYTHFE